MDLDQINESITELQNAFQRLRLERTFESSDGVTPFTPRTFVEEGITTTLIKKEKDDDDEEEEKGKKSPLNCHPSKAQSSLERTLSPFWKTLRDG
jgi:hypothetical protein